jgi:hypothetical protein
MSGPDGIEVYKVLEAALSREKTSIELDKCVCYFKGYPTGQWLSGKDYEVL